jgi:hypothetical protein
VGDASCADAVPGGIPPIADQAIKIAGNENGERRFRSEFTVTSGSAVVDRSEILPSTGARHRRVVATIIDTSQALVDLLTARWVDDGC